MSKTTNLDLNVGDMDNCLRNAKLMCLFNGMVKRRFLNMGMGRSMGMTLDGFIVRQEGIS